MKLVYLFIYLGRNISFNESDNNLHVDKAWTAMDSLW